MNIIDRDQQAYDKCRFYTGVGSRRTPAELLPKMTAGANYLMLENFILRSGGAVGADSAFEANVHDWSMKEIYLIWKNSNNHQSPYYGVSNEAMEIASQFHPNWDACSSIARKLHGRNVYQLLGPKMNKPSEFVLCYTPDGKDVGGTGQTLRMARHWNIPVFNIGVTPLNIIADQIKEIIG